MTNSREQRAEKLEAMLDQALRLRDEYMERWQESGAEEWREAVKKIAEVQFILMDLKANER